MYGVAPPAPVKSAGYVPGNPGSGSRRSSSPTARPRPGPLHRGPAPPGYGAAGTGLAGGQLRLRPGPARRRAARRRSPDPRHRRPLRPGGQPRPCPAGRPELRVPRRGPRAGLAPGGRRGEGSRARRAAQVKHYAANNQEKGDARPAPTSTNARCGSCTFLPSGPPSPRAGRVGHVRRQPVNGAYSCENNHLLAEVLDGEWGFDGVVGSDYAATHSAVASVRAGLDQSFDSRQWAATTGTSPPPCGPVTWTRRGHRTRPAHPADDVPDRAVRPPAGGARRRHRGPAFARNAAAAAPCC